MSKQFVEITGFKEVLHKIVLLGDDKSKTKSVRRILGQAANSTVKAAKNLAPKDKGLKVRDKTYKRGKRQVRNVVVQESYTTGFAKKSIGKKVMKRARNPMLVVRANDISIGSKKKYGGWYVRQMLIRGTKYISGNPFMDKALAQTKGGVVKDLEKRMERYIQKEINRLSNA